MNWFLIYWDLLWNTGIFGLLLLFSSVVILFSFIVTLLNKDLFEINIRMLIPLIIVLAVFFTIFPLDLGEKWRITMEMAYFFIPYGLLMGFSLPTINYLDKNGIKKTVSFRTGEKNG